MYKVIELVSAVMSTNKSELVEVNDYDDIDSNDEDVNVFCIVCFTYVPYTLQEDVESYGNKLSYGKPVFNAIYTSPVRPKSCFYV